MITGIQVSSFKPMLTTEEEVRTAFFKMKEMGCDTVQLQWIDWSVTPDFIAQALKDAGISSVSTQDFYQTVKEHKDYFIRLNQLCGSEWVCVSGIPDSNRTPEGLQAFVKELSEFQKELTDKQEKLRIGQTAYHRESSRLESLKNITERYDGYGNSIRKVMANKDREKGLIGVVADIIKVDKEYEIAV